MTEAEWLACEGPIPRQLAGLHQFASLRKIQLVAAAYVQAAQARAEYEGAKPCDDLIEAVADQLRSSEEIALELAARPGHWGLTHVMAVPQEPAAVAEGLRHLALTYPTDRTRLAPELLRLIHEVVGNPFRPVSLDPAWLTPTATALARQMYDSRDFAPMPILADALQDAGCETADVLAHCRGPGPHVRGCWVIDLMLEKL